MPPLHRSSGNGCADQVPILGVTFFQIATTDKPDAINPSNFFLLGFIFPKNYYSGLFHHLYTGLSNDGRINDGCVMVRSVSCPQFGERLTRDTDRPMNTGFVTPAPRTDIGFDARPHLFNFFA